MSYYSSELLFVVNDGDIREIALLHLQTFKLLSRGPVHSLVHSFILHIFIEYLLGA